MVHWIVCAHSVIGHDDLGLVLVHFIENGFVVWFCRMIKCRTEDRISPAAALQHSFLDFADVPSCLSDMMLLPTTTLLLENIHPENGKTG